MKISTLCLPLQTSLLNSGQPLWHVTGTRIKAESSSVNDVDVKTSAGQAKECESREMTQHYRRCLCLSSLNVSSESVGLQTSAQQKVHIILPVLTCITTHECFPYTRQTMTNFC